ncbi:hypothetical protein IQ06DRAFT_338335 [Phaeosphaeriaceae sp. SRC1lsM3a]|nr:hypothetical protein IQ06DRAFT_338335 [Stagonospora sp. SRC1lsM3a]
MCNIITYQFACPHRIRRRRSPCHGAKAKSTSNSTTSPRAACVAESFLTLYLRIPCNACNHVIWTAEWESKLLRATTYSASMRDEDSSAETVQTVEALINDLKARKVSEEWEMRNSLTMLPTRPISRVWHKLFSRAASPLKDEVRPEDVREGAKSWKDWSEMREEDYDDDYVASMDPIHPVTTDYRFPGEGEEDEWVEEYLADGVVEGGEDQGDKGSERSDTGGWDWGDGDGDGGQGIVQREEWGEEGIVPTKENGSQVGSNGETDLELINKTEPSLPTIPKNPASTPANQIAKPDLDAIIANFWSHVNPTTTSNPYLPNTAPPTSSSSYSSSSSPSPAQILPSPPPTTPPWIDGTHDFPFLPILTSSTTTLNSTPTTPQSSSSPSTYSSSSSSSRTLYPHRTYYDTQRRLLKHRKHLDPAKFYKDWLCLSRCEMREYEGLGEGERRIVEPARESRGEVKWKGPS